MIDVIFKVEDVVKKYRKKRFSALCGFEMEIRRGEIYGFIGQNGAGKTTLMRILAGFARQTSGRITLFGESSGKGLCQKRRYINGIIETPAFYPGLTAWDNLEVCCLPRGIADQEHIARSLEVAGLTGADADSTKAGNFSLGMKQRLGIAMALLGEPQFLFFDEPFNGLDPVGVRDFRELIRTLGKSGRTVLISCHMLRELDSLATCYGFIHRGKMVEQISAGELAGKCRRYLSLTVDHAARAVEILRKSFGAVRTEIASNNVVHVYGGLDLSGEMMKALFADGIAVAEMTVGGEDLEQYYLSLIKNQ